MHLVRAGQDQMSGGAHSLPQLSCASWEKATIAWVSKNGIKKSNFPQTMSENPQT